MYNKNHLDYRDFEKALQSKNYAPNTISNYAYYLGLFFEYTDKPRTKLTSKDVDRYVKEISMCTNSVKNQSISAIKLFFKYVLHKKIDYVFTERPRKTKKLPRVIHDEELVVKLDRIPNMKHRAMLTMGYRCGLRVSEVCSIKLTDVDTQSMCIMVRDSKFNKDRQIPISQDTVQLLMWYCEEYDPCDYLFEGQNGKYSVSSCQKIFKKYIDANGSWHVLRHSYATTLVEKNVNMRVIQSALGHESSRTSEIYTHVSRTALQGAML